MLDPLGAAVHRTFLAAYPGYVRARLGGADAPGLDTAIDAGAAWLDSALDGLLGTPFPNQARSPLEILQEAMRFPTSALTAAGFAGISRDPAEEAALPGDTYRLAPASSQDLGDEAWRAHLEWGAAKARALTTGAAVAYCGGNLMDMSALEGPVLAAGLELVVAGDETALAEALDQRQVVLALVDLAGTTADGCVRLAAEAGVRTIGFGPHVDDQALVRARSLGAEEALPRSVFFRRLPGLLPDRA